MKLTETKLKTLRPKTSHYRVFEKGIVKGFGVKVLTSGLISYFVCYTIDGKTKYKTLGQFPEMSLELARIEAGNFRRGLGEDPVEIKTGTLRELCLAYIKHLVDGGKDKRGEIERSLKKDVLEVLDGDKPANKITTNEIRDAVHNCVERGALVMGNRVRSHLMAAFQYGMQHDYDPRKQNGELLFGLTINPVSLIPRMTDVEVPKDRVLTIDELKVVWNCFDELSLKHTYILRLLILFCGQRPGEVCNARVDEFDFEQKVWLIPPERIKNGRWHSLPLTDYAEEAIRSAMKNVGNDLLLFPGKVSPEQPECETALHHAVSRLCKRTGMVKWTPADLRRTCKTHAGSAGVSKEIRDRLQNHALNDVSSKHYDRYLYLPEKKLALEQWEEYLREVGVIN